MERLKAGGYRTTEPRRRVLRVLEAAGTPLAAAEVAARAGTSVASTYRVLGLLAQLGMVSEVAEPGAEGADGRLRLYARCSAGEHHHHFVCRICHRTLDVASEPLERALTELAAGHGLRIEAHEITLRGQCSHCVGEAGASTWA